MRYLCRKAPFLCLNLSSKSGIDDLDTLLGVASYLTDTYQGQGSANAQWPGSRGAAFQRRWASIANVRPKRCAEAVRLMGCTWNVASASVCLEEKRWRQMEPVRAPEQASLLKRVPTRVVGIWDGSRRTITGQAPNESIQSERGRTYGVRMVLEAAEAAGRGRLVGDGLLRKGM